jgi:hypothetical protein
VKKEMGYHPPIGGRASLDWTTRCHCGLLTVPDELARRGVAEMRHRVVTSKPRDILLDLIYGAIADPRRWPEVLTRVADHLGAVGGLLMHIPAPGKGRVTDVYGRLSDEYGAIVRDHYPWNPWTKAMLGVPADRAAVVSSLLDQRELSKTAFYADVLPGSRRHHER